ncbi:hypothetical protein CEXT_423301 [Caerostris extrusa]|uniref:Uncharacterized protein n=1 Tax=Caerostris extrusa TaxID=172846 RepID=A0AAV4VZ84_CAEEX|nr:hypothetical protein CEXT_423301 [Caerostris extrusa]
MGGGGVGLLIALFGIELFMWSVAIGVWVTTSTIEHNRTPPPPPPNPKVIDDGTWSEGENVTGHRSRWMAAFGSCNDGGRGGVGFGRAGACGDLDKISCHES